MMKITKEGLSFKTTTGAKLFKLAITLGTCAFIILTFGFITVS